MTEYKSEYVPLGSVISIKNISEISERATRDDELFCNIIVEDGSSAKYVVVGYEHYDGVFARMDLATEEKFDAARDGQVYLNGGYQYVIMRDLRGVKAEIVGTKEINSAPDFERHALVKDNVKTDSIGRSTKVTSVQLWKLNGVVFARLTNNSSTCQTSFDIGEGLAWTRDNSKKRLPAENFYLSVASGVNGPTG